METINNKRSTINDKLKGFTLIELLVVIAIIGVLATFIVASFSNAQARSRDARRKSDLDAVKKALSIYKNSTTSGRYPPLGGLGLLVPTYIDPLPTDPINAAPYLYSYFGVPSGCNLAGFNCIDFRYYTVLETVDDATAASQTRCPAVSPPGPVSWTAQQYVVCAD